MKTVRLFLIITLLAVNYGVVHAQEHRLWYAQPAAGWLEALPIGNSHLGAMVYGGTDIEEIQLNEETFSTLTNLDERIPSLI